MAMRYDPIQGALGTVVITRSARGITWQFREVMGGLVGPATIEFVEHPGGWRLAMPWMPAMPIPDAAVSIDTWEVSWRGDHLWSEVRGTSSNIGGPVPTRSAIDCARAP